MVSSFLSVLYRWSLIFPGFFSNIGHLKSRQQLSLVLIPPTATLYIRKMEALPLQDKRAPRMQVAKREKNLRLVQRSLRKKQMLCLNLILIITQVCIDHVLTGICNPASSPACKNKCLKIYQRGKVIFFLNTEQLRA